MMTNKSNANKVINFLQENDFICDDCLSEKCSIYPRQQINSITTKLASEKMVNKEKGICSICLKDKLVSSKAISKIQMQTRKMPFTTEKEIEKYLSKWNSLDNYVLQESSLDKLFHRTYPSNTEMDDVLIKVCSLNDFYSTNIFSPFDVAKHIVQLKIDERLKEGDLNLVNDIATITIKKRQINFYSFASKYCSHHFEIKYPIFDSFVEKVLKYLRKEDKFYMFEDCELKQYKKFYNILLEFRKFYKLEKYNLKEIDKYLWQVGKDYFPKNYKKHS